MIEQLVKKCSKCKEIKNISYFSKDKRLIIWLKASCKECNKSYYNENSEKKQSWRDKNKEKISIYNKKYSVDNPGIKAKHNRKWRLKNFEVRRLYSSKYRALKRTTEDWSITINNTKNILDKQWWACNICWLDIIERTSRHLDHIHPLSKWWTHTIDNVQWLCIHCNLVKSDNIL